MFGKRIRLFKIFGFDIGVDWSWILLALLVAWSLSVGFFPFHYKNLTSQTYWFMGIVGTLGLFFSIIFHESCHSLVARRYGIPMNGITLFIFGGVAEMDEEPASPRAEFMMALAGPLSSLFLGAVFYGIYVLGSKNGWMDPVTGVFGYLAFINVLLAIFNMIPAFPLDGGRVLRSVLWGWKNNFRWATRIASRIGSGFGILLIILGVTQIFAGNLIGGMWWVFIGMFLKNAVRSSYQQLYIREAFQGELVQRFMKENPVTVPPSLTVTEFVEDYVYRYHHKMFPVVDEQGRLAGCITTRDIKEIPREEWKGQRVGDIASQCSAATIIGPRVEAIKALSLMNKSGLSRLIVAEGNNLLGVITLKDMLSFLSLKMELEDL